MLTWRQIALALKAGAFLTELEVGADNRLPKTAGDAQRRRLLLEDCTTWALSEDPHVTLVFELRGLWGGGFEYTHTKLGLGVEARGRYLLAHQKSVFDEVDASLTLKADLRHRQMPPVAGIGAGLGCGGEASRTVTGPRRRETLPVESCQRIERRERDKEGKE